MGIRVLLHVLRQAQAKIEVTALNLNAIAGDYTAVIVPQLPIIVRVSDGYDVGANARQIPRYLPPVYVYGAIQSLTYRDLQQTEGLNLQGEQRAIYINGRVEGLVRPDSKGGDLITFPDGSEWLTTLVLEYWVGWVKVAATMQRRPALAPAAGVVEPVRHLPYPAPPSSGATFLGFMVANELLVTSLISGHIRTGGIVTGPNVIPGTVITGQIADDAYTISPLQTAGPGTFTITSLQVASQSRIVRNVRPRIRIVYNALLRGDD